MAIAISAPYPNFFTPDGAPLEGGYVYIGVEGLNPIANPQPAYWDEALTIPAPAEVRVTGGYIVYNGAPARLYVAGNYSILVADKNGRTIFSRLYNTVYDADLFLTETRGTLTRSMRTPPSFNFDLITDGGYYSWTNAGTANFPSGAAAADLFALEVLAAPDGAGIIYQRVVDISIAYATERYSWERKSIDAGATWSDWVSPLYQTDYAAISPGATPYNIVMERYITTLLVTTGAGAFVCNLPTAASSIGKTIRIIKIDSGAGAIQIAPNGADVIANAGNVSIYIGKQFRHITLQAQAAGQWIVTGGEWQPAQAVDTNGTHLSLGRLHRLPLDNTTNRAVISAAASPAESAWSAAYAVSGSFGIPVGAKAIRAKVIITIAKNVNTGLVLDIAFSDNTANTPSRVTAHSEALAYGSINIPTSTGASSIVEIDIPLNSSGQFYIYSIIKTAALLVDEVTVSAIGYYMGD